MPKLLSASALALAFVPALAHATAAIGAGDGACLGTLFVSGSDKPVRQDGPDFELYSVGAATGTVGVYVGCCSQVSDAERERFASVDGETVFRVSETGEFRGYLIDVVKRREGTDWHTQYHFFGSGLADAAADHAFFERLSFRKGPQHDCGT